MYSINFNLINISNCIVFTAVHQPQIYQILLRLMTLRMAKRRNKVLVEFGHYLPSQLRYNGSKLSEQKP